VQQQQELGVMQGHSTCAFRLHVSWQTRKDEQVVLQAGATTAAATEQQGFICSSSSVLGPLHVTAASDVTAVLLSACRTDLNDKRLTVEHMVLAMAEVR
jgi:hypothetical protein